MGIFDIFKRKKNEDELQITPDLEGTGPIPPADFGPLPQENLQPSFQEQGVNSRDIDLIITKLDLIDKKLETIDNRLKFIEKIAKESR